MLAPTLRGASRQPKPPGVPCQPRAWVLQLVSALWSIAMDLVVACETTQAIRPRTSFPTTQNPNPFTPLPSLVIFIYILFGSFCKRRRSFVTSYRTTATEATQQGEAINCGKYSNKKLGRFPRRARHSPVNLDRNEEPQPCEGVLSR